MIPVVMLTGISIFFWLKMSFPGIIENDLRNGVGDVHYTIDLSSCIPFRVSEADFLSGLGRDLCDQRE